ncbi:hypothetical protein BU26DRAFT_517408 [Trematosphaeria pertusa]|uniref:Mediator of RNA polymerase II transcription subunit 6 n=1 Tax=Trematosphaeria pertusa TaxID=390896 RepID=A0A6A6IJ24_9PLEO|nr:uncharacterized protein BU26DRAFT_517408 [Trematosphaeria pertusa]KAF2250574.1 hypothetical protein BU26DRAFT_517408 [Trematosphaeria pertusa]
MPPQLQPLDESEYDEPAALRGLPGGTLNSESILWYFMGSPFFDASSNNVALFNHLRQLGPAGQPTLDSRHAFEEALLSKYNHGSYFVVASEPKREGEPWVIQRQRKDQGSAEIVVEGTWYTQGTKILMAPSLLDVLQLRLLSVSTQLQDFFELSKNLSHFSPAMGHTYLPPSYEPPKAATASRAGSRIGSPALAAIDAPAAASQTQSQPQTLDAETNPTEFSDPFFFQSLALTNAFGNEYMDENPLQGEPGSFVFANTLAHVDARNKAQQQQQQQQQQQAAQAASGASTTTPAAGNIKAETQSVNSIAATPKAAAAPAPAPAAPEAQSRKASTASLPKPGKEKRRKSKGLTSPTTPAAP